MWDGFPAFQCHRASLRSRAPRAWFTPVARGSPYHAAPCRYACIALSQTITFHPVTQNATQALLDTYGAATTARWIDRVERRYASGGQAFFHLSGTGHEAAAALAPHLGPQDWLFCHYRSKALMVARGATPRAFFDGFFAKAASASQGRLMGVHFHDRALRLYSTMGPVGNHALHAVGVASVVKSDIGAPVVLCGIGDGTAQEGEVLEAIGEAVRSHLPVLFLVEDNGYAISARTRGRTFFSLPAGDAESFFGVPISRCDGNRIPRCLTVFGEAVQSMRTQRGPAIVVVGVQRADSHSNADDHRTYRDEPELANAREADPLQGLSADLLALGVDADTLERIDQEAATLVSAAARDAFAGAEPKPVAEPCSISFSLPLPQAAPDVVRAPEMHTMLSALRGALRHRLASDAKVALFGQDIEDPKGDVFGLTRGLSDEFGGRVQNAPLSEATIVGASYGRALAGVRPVAMLQFADFIPLALNQLLQELAMHTWRSPDSKPAPVVVMAPCGAYREGLGPYHAQTFDSHLAHVPGIVVAVPSNAEDAAGLLNAALASDTSTVFLYPKSLLNAPDASSFCDPSAAWALPGSARTLATGSDLTIVSWGSTVTLCMEAVRHLTDLGVTVHLLDLRTLAPWDRDAVRQSCAATGRLLVVHEDNLTGGFGGEVVAAVVEALDAHIKVRRLARPDEPVPYNYARQCAILPQAETIMRAALDLVGAEAVSLPAGGPAPADASVFTIHAFRASPSDNSFKLLRIAVAVGDQVVEGHILGEYETDKCAAELMSPVAGTVRAINAGAGDTIPIGECIIEIEPELPIPIAPPAVALTPEFRVMRRADSPAQARMVCSLPAVARGSRRVENVEIANIHPGRTPADIVRGTGIESRQWVDVGEDAVILGARAARQLLDGVEEADLNRIGVVLVATSSVDRAAPSIACRVTAELARAGVPLEDPPALDILAACSGFLYGLRIAHDHLCVAPGELVLLLTTETLSPMLDPGDFGTRALFADAASAVLIGAPQSLPAAVLAVSRPILGARPDPSGALTVPCLGSGQHIAMDGGRVFREAVRTMAGVARRCCHDAGVAPGDLRYIVAHQANQRILDAVAAALGVEDAAMASNIRDTGNTSASSIPLLLAHLAEGGALRAGDKLCLCTFGAGFTYGASFAEALPTSAS
jgi:2-oxoisovalerate dehydrogenase E1 component